MTFDQCHETLTEIRRRQGTTTPILRVHYGGADFRGRLARSDSDPGGLRSDSGPYGVLVLAPEGLAPGPQTLLQIGSIPPGGIEDLAER